VTPSSLCTAAAYRSPKRTPLAGEGKPGKKLRRVGRSNQLCEISIIQIKSSAQGVSQCVRNSRDVLAVHAQIVRKDNLSEFAGCRK